MALARWFRIRAVCDEQPNSRDAQVGDLVRQVHLLRQILPNFRQQLARAVGFRHIVVTAGRASSFFLAAERIGGDRDDRDRLTLIPHPSSLSTLCFGLRNNQCRVGLLALNVGLRNVGVRGFLERK